MSILNRFVVATLPFVPISIVGAVSRRYIAGVTLQEAVDQIRALNAAGFSTTTDLLGEYISRLDEAESNRQQIEEIFAAIAASSLTSTVSVKLSQMGQLLDQEACYANARILADRARRQSNRLTLDMEDASTVDKTLDIFYRLRKEGFPNVGMVSQAYLRRASSDIRTLVERGGGEVRLCKGIYIEPESVAYKGKEEVRENFLRLFIQLLDGNCFVGIATHDEVLIRRSLDVIRQRSVPQDRYEYQMLLGVREDLRDAIRRDGHPLRVYVPFGEHWYAYSVRRLRENPEIAGYVFKAIFGLNAGPKSFSQQN